MQKPIIGNMKMLLVKDVMTKTPVCVRPDDLVTKARSILRKRGYRALPVVDGSQLVGIISREDILRITSTKTNIKVSGLMNPNIITAFPGDELLNAAKKIVVNKVRQLPVVDTGLVGIISSLDILKSFVKNNYMPHKNTIRDIMIKNVVYCRPDDELSKIWGIMLKSGFGGLPVVEEDKVIGMLTRMDVIKHGSARLSRESGRVKNISVEKVMKKPAITTKPGESTTKVAKIMVENKIIRIPVSDPEMRLVGIVDIEDVLSAYIW